jgi:signal transduction histidine kinase
VRFALRTKIWLFTLAPLLLISATTLLIVRGQVEKRVRENLAVDLETAAENLRSNLATREDDLETIAFVISRDPKFFAMLTVPIAERGPEFEATIRDVSTDFQRAVGHELFDVHDERGRLLSRISEPAATGRDEGEVPGIREALSGRPVSGIAFADGAPFQVAVVPIIVGDRIAGVLRLGKPIDASLARRLRELTRSEVSFLAGPRVTATTLEDEAAARTLAASVSRAARAGEGAPRPLAIGIGREPYLTKAEVIEDQISPGILTFVVQRSLRTELAFLTGMERILAIIGVLGALAAAVAGVVVARGVTAPITRVVRAGEAMERGNYEYPLDVSTGDEVEYLARQFAAMRESMRTSISHLEELDRLKSNFISIASHELRTPVTALKGYIYLLKENENDPLSTEQRELVDGLESSTDVLGGIVQEITDMSLLDRKGLPLDAAPTALDELVAAVIERNASSFRRRRLAARSEVEPGLPRVLVDHERLGQALQNLVSNAIRFTPDGGQVAVGARQDGDEVALWVADSGIGIPEKEFSRIFDRIYEVGTIVHHSSGTIEFGSSGIGLGLPIAKGIVEAHGGRISVKSAVGKGSVFTIHLPGRAVVRGLGPQPPAPMRAVESERDDGSRREAPIAEEVTR